MSVSDSDCIGHKQLFQCQENAEIVTIFPCSGGANIQLYDGDSLLWEDAIGIRPIYPNQPVLEQYPPIPNAKEPSLRSLFKVGNSEIKDYNFEL